MPACCGHAIIYVSRTIMTTTWRLGEGAVALDDHGAPTAFAHDQLPTNGFLLSQATDSWHTADRCWGAGFVITDHGAAHGPFPTAAPWMRRGRHSASGMIVEHPSITRHRSAAVSALAGCNPSRAMRSAVVPRAMPKASGAAASIKSTA